MAISDLYPLLVTGESAAGDTRMLAALRLVEEQAGVRLDLCLYADRKVNGEWPAEPGGPAYHTSAHVAGSLTEPAKAELLGFAEGEMQRAIAYFMHRAQPGQAISTQVLLDTAVALRNSLAHHQDGALQRAVVSGPGQVVEPRRVQISIAQRDALIAAGVMPLPKNLQPRPDGSTYDPLAHGWRNKNGELIDVANNG
jgi:hypothetical protein